MVRPLAVPACTGFTVPYDIHAMAYDPLGRKLYAANANGVGREFFEIDPETCVRNIINQNVPYTIHGMTWNTDTGELYGANNSGEFFRIDPSNGMRTLIGAGAFAIEALAYVPNPTTCLVSGRPVAGRFYGSSGGVRGATFFEIDACTGIHSVVNLLPPPGFGGPAGMNGLTYNENTGRLYGANCAGSVLEVDVPQGFQCSIVDSGPVCLESLVFLHDCSLGSPASAVSLSSGGLVPFNLDAGPARANDLYAIAGSLSGTSPETLVGGTPMPLAFDSYLLFTVTFPNSPLMPNSVGLLDANGQASATLVIPPGTAPSLAGLTANHAYVVLRLPAVTARCVSNPAPTLILP